MRWWCSSRAVHALPRPYEARPSRGGTKSSSYRPSAGGDRVSMAPVVCVACGEVTRTPWLAGAQWDLGPRVQATVALYTGAYRLSKRTRSR